MDVARAKQPKAKISKPDLVAADAQIAQVTRKLNNVAKTKEDVTKSSDTWLCHMRNAKRKD